MSAATGDRDAAASGRDLQGVGRSLPGVALRVALVLAGAAALLSVAGGRPGGGAAALGGLLLLATAVAPDSLAANGFLLVLLGLQAGVGGLDVRCAVTVAGGYAVHLLAALAAGVPRAARVEVAALRPAARRAGAVLAGAAAVGAAASGVRPGSAPEALGVAAVVLCGAVVVLLLRPSGVSGRRG